MREKKPGYPGENRILGQNSQHQKRAGEGNGKYGILLLMEMSSTEVGNLK
jgi:hypothetical protein